MKIPITEPAKDWASAAVPATGEQEQFKFSNETQYLRIAQNFSKKSRCRCWSCDTVEDFTIDYYSNPSILLDNDCSIHIPRVMK